VAETKKVKNFAAPAAPKEAKAPAEKKVKAPKAAFDPKALFAKKDTTKAAPAAAAAAAAASTGEEGISPLFWAILVLFSPTAFIAAYMVKELARLVGQLGK
jgi:hypothetical protein